MTRPHLQRHPSLTQSLRLAFQVQDPDRPLSLTPQSSLHQSAAVRKNLQYPVPTQSSDLLSSPSELWSSVSPPHEVTPLTAATQGLKCWREKDGKAQPSLTWAMHDVIKWWLWLGGTLKVISDTSQVMCPFILKVG
jgi:hypothetical protein